MKKIFFTLSVFAILVAFVADDLTRIGTTTDEMQNLVVSSMARDTFSIKPPRKVREACKAIPAAQQGAAVQGVLKLVRAFVESDEFAKRYDSYQRMVYDIDNPETASPTIKQDIEKSLGNLDNAKLSEAMSRELNMMESMAQGYEKANDTQKKAYEQRMGSIDNFKKQIESIKKLQEQAKSNPEQARKDYISYKVTSSTSALERSVKQRRESSLAAYAQTKNHKVFLVNQLKDFLKETDDIDFGAQTKTNEAGKKIFVKPEYEAKSAEWKFYYRCGKEPVAAAREFAKAWLKDLDKK